MNVNELLGHLGAYPTKFPILFSKTAIVSNSNGGILKISNSNYVYSEFLNININTNLNRFILDEFQLFDVNCAEIYALDHKVRKEIHFSGIQNIRLFDVYAKIGRDQYKVLRPFQVMLGNRECLYFSLI